MARRVFFSFHYDDVMRVNVVRNSDQIVRRYDRAARFHDRSLWEEAKKQGRIALKRMINRALVGSSVTCVLIGQQTWQRPWVRYEILKSLARGNGILAVHIHDVGFDPKSRDDGFAPSVLSQPRSQGLRALSPSRSTTSSLLSGHSASTPTGRLSGLASLRRAVMRTAQVSRPGPNPLDQLMYRIDRQRGTVRFYERRSQGWRQYLDLSPVPLADIAWLRHGADAGNLGTVFSVYGWTRDDGFRSLPNWIEAAARQVGR